MTEPDLIRFVHAQDQVYGRVIEELTDGCKRTHWMWLIFPQLAGLGHSALAQRYAIRDLDQANRYLADPPLEAACVTGVRLMIGHKVKSALEILGSPDDLKFRSSPHFYLLKRRPITPTACYSPKAWISSMMASRTSGRWNC